jgi:hypothetical protein
LQPLKEKRKWKNNMAKNTQKINAMSMFKDVSVVAQADKNNSNDEKNVIESNVEKEVPCEEKVTKDEELTTKVQEQENAENDKDKEIKEINNANEETSEESQDEKKKAKVGRPSVYSKDESFKRTSFSFPEEVYLKLETLAEINKKSNMTGYLIDLINKEYEAQNELIAKYKELFSK